MSWPIVVLIAVGGAGIGAFVLVPALRIIPEPWDPPRAATVAVPVANALLWGLAANRFSRVWVVLPYLVVFSVLLAVSVVDVRLFRIPDRFVFPGLAATVVLMVIGSFVVLSTTRGALDVLRYAGIGLVTYFGILFVFHVIYPRGMGFGDVKLAALMGLSLGWLGDSSFAAAYLVLISLFIGCVLGIVFGLTWRLTRREGGAFPFGPALAAAAIYVVLDVHRYLSGV